MADELLKKVEFYLDQVMLWDFPEGFRHLEIFFDGNKKPVCLMNGLHECGANETGIVFTYGADPRNLHDREVFTALTQSGIFDGLDAKLYGYDGKSWRRNFGRDKKAVMDLLCGMVSITKPFFNAAESKMHFSGLYGPAERPWVIVEDL